MESLLDVFPAFWQSFLPQLHGFFIIILQLREPHSHASNTRSEETFVS